MAGSNLAGRLAEEYKSLKNLMIHISPSKDFNSPFWGDESKTLIKIQVDNSLEYGWKVEDILLVTNFDYEYRGVRSVVVSGDNYCDFAPPTSKVNAIISLFNLNMIDEDLYWFHDLDAFQVDDITEKDVDLESNEIGITNYGGSYRWSTGSIFFKNGSKDIFELVKDKSYEHEINEEDSLMILTGFDRRVRGEILPGYDSPIKDRVKKINLKYNFALRNRRIRVAYREVEKPLKVLHFHPFDKKPVDMISACMYGNNVVGEVFMPDNLIGIFHNYGIK